MTPKQVATEGRAIARLVPDEGEAAWAYYAMCHRLLAIRVLEAISAGHPEARDLATAFLYPDAA